MIKPITQYMRNNTAYCVQGPIQKIHDVTIKERIFLDKDFNTIARSTSYLVDRCGKRLIKTVLQTAEGLLKITDQKQNIIKLSTNRGKKVTKYPYSMYSSVFYNENKPAKRKLFFILDGVSFEKSDDAGILIYKRNRNFKTRNLTAHTSVNKEDFFFDTNKL